MDEERPSEVRFPRTGQARQTELFNVETIGGNRGPLCVMELLSTETGWGKPAVRGAAGCTGEGEPGRRRVTAHSQCGDDGDSPELGLTMKLAPPPAQAITHIHRATYSPSSPALGPVVT